MECAEGGRAPRSFPLPANFGSPSCAALRQGLKAAEPSFLSGLMLLPGAKASGTASDSTNRKLPRTRTVSFCVHTQQCLWRAARESRSGRAAATMANRARSGSVSKGGLAGPDKPTIVQCKVPASLLRGNGLEAGFANGAPPLPCTRRTLDRGAWGV